MPVLLSVFLMGSTLSSFAQEISKEDYLAKSKRQKTTGFILLGGGIALAAAGGILFSENFILFGASDAEDNAVGIGGAMFIVGGLAALSSIPVFISSGSNAKKAAQLSFRNEPINIPKYAGNFPRAVPSVTFSIPLH